MIIKKRFLSCVISLLLLSACTQESASFQLPSPPQDIMQPPASESLFKRMESQLNGSSTMQMKPKDTEFR